MNPSEQEIQHNIEKLRNKIGDARTGGKGTKRRKVKVVSKNTTGNDKLVKGIVKRVGAQPLGVDEVNFFKDDNTIMHFVKPETYASIENQTFIVAGEPETKTIKDLLPDIIQQLGPKQHKLLKELVSGNQEEVNDEAPQLEEAPEELSKPE